MTRIFTWKVLLFAVLAVIGNANAQSVLWTGGSGDWMVPTNWDQGNVPNSANDVTIGPGDATIHSGDGEALSLLVSGVDGNGYITVASGASLTVGNSVSLGNDGTQGLMNVRGNVVASEFIVGNTGIGELNLFGSSSLTVTGGTLQLGATGGSNGYLNIGSSAETAGSLIASEVSGGAGPGDRNVAFLHTGDHTFSPALTGNLAVYKNGPGATVLTGNNTYTGSTTVDSGTLEIRNGTISNDGGTIVRSGTLRVAGAVIDDGRTRHVFVGVDDQNSGAVVMSSGNVNTGHTAIANHGGATGSVTITGGAWNTDILDIGNEGNGTMTVSGGVVLAANGATVGNANEATGELLIKDSGEVTIQQGTGDPGVLLLGVTENATGTLKMGDGGTAGTLNAAAVSGGAGSATVEFNHTGNLAFAPELNGSLGVRKLGSGTTTLTNASFYSGKTRVQAGTLVIQSGSALSGEVEVQGGTFLVKANVSVTGAMKLMGGTFSRELVAGGSLSALNSQSDISGGTPTTVLLSGEVSANATIVSSFLATSLATNDEVRMSDVFSFSGVPVINGTTGETDTFVMQMQLSEEDFSETAILGWLNPQNAWENAVLGNIGGVAVFVNGAYAPGMTVGTYGRDESTNTVWAVVNHNSEFSVIPEPTSIALLAAGMVMLLRRRRQ